MGSGVSESGEGFTFQQRISVHLMCLVAAEQPPPYGRGVAEIAGFQISHTGLNTDDQKLVVKLDGTRINHFIQCKRSVSFRSSHPDFQAFLARAYSDLQKDYEGKTVGDLFILATVYVTKLEAFEELLGIAQGSLSVGDLSSKLDNNSVRDMLKTTREALAKGLGGAEIDESIFHALLTRIRIWNSDLIKESSRDERDTITYLADYTSERSEAQAQRIIADMRSKIGIKEPKRYTYSLDLIRQEFKGLIAKAAPNPAANYMSTEYLDQLEEEVKRLTSKRIERFTYEAYLDFTALWTCEFPKYSSQSGTTGPAAQRIQNLFCAIHDQIGAALHQMEARNELLQQWIITFRSMTTQTVELQYRAAHIAIVLDDMAFFDECKQFLSSGQRLAVDAKLAIEQERWEDALAISEMIPSEYEFDKQLVRRIGFSERAIEDPKLAIEAWRAGQLAHQCAPTRTLTNLVAIDSLGVLIHHTTSPFVTLSVTPPPEWPKIIYDSQKELENLLDADLGEFELTATLQVYDSLLGDERQVDIAKVLPHVPEWMKITKPGKLLSFCLLAYNAQHHEMAKGIMTLVRNQELSEHERGELARLDGAYSGETQNEPAIPSLNPDGDDLINALNARTAYLACVAREDPRQGIYLKKVLEVKTDHALKVEVSVISLFLSENYIECGSQIDDMIQRFPNAWQSWKSIAYFLPLIFRKKFFDFKVSKSHFAVGLEKITKRGQVAYKIVDRAVTHTSIVLQDLDVWYRRLSLCSLVEDSSEYERLSKDAEENERPDIRNNASAYSSFLSGRFDEAVEFWNEAELLGALGDNARIRRDYARFRDGRYQDLVDDVDSLMKNPRRTAITVAPTVSALRILDSPERALAVARQNLLDFPDNPISLRLSMDTELAIGSTKLGFELMKRLAEEFPTEGGVHTIPFEDNGELPKEMQSALEDQDPALQQYNTVMFPIHLASGSSIVRRFIHLTSTPNGLHSERAFDMRALTKENYGLPVILDITAVLSISKFKLWNAMRESGLVYKLPGSVYQTLRKERDELKLCRVRDIESRLKGYKELMAHPKVESVPRLNPVEDFKDGDLHTYEELNMRLLSERGGDFCDSFADVNNQVWTIPKLIRSALLTGKFTASQEYSLRAKLEPHLENVMWDQESHGEFPAKIMFSGLDLDALSQIPESKLILDLFETVYVGPGNHFEIGLLIGAGSHIETSFEFSSIAFSELEAAISQGIVTMQKDLNRPDCDSPLYLMELCAMAEKEKCDVWVDDSATRGLLAGQAISAFSNSTQSMVEHLHSSGVLSITKVNDLRIELLREGYRDSLWQQSLVYAAETPAHQKSFEIIVKRLCCGILPGLYRTQYELQEYLSFLWANLYALCTRCPELEPYLRIATNVALEFTGKLTLHVWGALFDELTKLDGYWIEDYVEWASELAVKNGAFTYGTFIELAISSVELKRAFPILEQGRNKEAFMRIWRILRERRAGITIKCLDQ